jgi:hypothetical protein
MTSPDQSNFPAKNVRTSKIFFFGLTMLDMFTRFDIKNEMITFIKPQRVLDLKMKWIYKELYVLLHDYSF